MKMQESPSFFSDPKVIIAIFALVVSMISLFWTLSNQWEQNRRWELLNNPNPELKEARLINFKEISYDEAQKTIWGYDPLIFAKGEAIGTYVLPYYLVPRDYSGSIIEGVNPIFTIQEVDNELKRIGYKEHKINLAKLFRPKFVFENMGKTEVRKLSIKIDVKEQNQEWKNAFTSNAIINLAGGQSTTAHFDFEIPLLVKLPDQFIFLVQLKYFDINNKEINKEIAVKWTTKDNFWSYDNSESKKN